MIDSTMYLVGIRKDTKEYEQGANSCQICRKMIINAGIKEIVVRGNSRGEYTRINIDEWIKNDDLLEGITVY